ncbi:uncharacterized protein METZ01_LOCUS169676 [marine metagenome]|uniref:Cytochrome b561 bacterial/Ni-hydrogenase domain-containing protein n=1 Tax=marine metagenome TaxID=408172 RepID=A0A382BTQ8_9ZZZZ|tara:strand:- start:193 stop:633 length:441 start_codon:yes stop_codon:yes gene_type:complete
MYTTLLPLHHYLAYAVLLLVTLFTFNSLWGWLSGRDSTACDKKLGLAAMLAVHIQFTLGLILYLVSPTVQQAFKDFGLAMKSSNLRLYALEHPLVILIAAVLITIARIKTKRSDSNSAHKTNFILYAISLLLILSRIPWAKWLGLS